MTGPATEGIAAHETHDVVVRAIASGGSGVADLPDGRVVFVPRTAPGDRVRIRIRKSRPRWAEGVVASVLDAAPERVEPPCSRYAECGGCQLQHLAYADQLLWKGRFVADALERIGHLAGIEPPEVVGSPDGLGYRTRVTYSLRRLRGGRVVAGFHALDRPNRILDLWRDCLLPDERLGAAWLGLRRGWGPSAERLPPGGQLRLTVRLVGEVVELIVQGGTGGWDATPLLEAVPALHAAWHTPGGAVVAVLAGGEATLGGGTAFDQVNPGAAELLREEVLAACLAQSSPPGRAIDAYCGGGELGRALAAEGWSMVGIESEPAAVEAASLVAIDGFRVVPGRVEDVLGSELPADLLVVNPPRSGLDASVPTTILADPPEALVYVSCDPATLARDVSALTERFELVRLRSFDLFPQTAHVETVAVLSRRGDAP